MCGIIGICGGAPITREDRSEVVQGAGSMRLRGPDDSGFIEKDGIYFGHRRLAILDPRAGQQPWVDPNTGTILVFNGELFNFQDLREKLGAEGATFRTHCDTELLMQAYLLWGRDCLAQFNGMFAFALYDPRKKETWLVRDRLGVKPLYYHLDGNRLRFASSMKGLFAFSAIERKLDLSVASHYLRTVRTCLGRRSLIEGVCSLQPGEELIWKAGKDALTTPVLRSYWKLPGQAKALDQKELSFEEAREETYLRVKSAVDRQMLSDVPVGGFLSGGIDSSILSHLASELGGRQFGTFSVGYDEAGYNEWDSIRINVEHNRLANEEIHLRPQDYRKDWQWLISEKGLPLSTPNEVPIYRLAKSFGTRYKVALSGEGADEVFGGYVTPTFCAFDWDRKRMRTSAIDAACFRNAYGSDNPGSRQEHFFRVNSWLDRHRIEQLFKPALISGSSGNPVETYYRDLFEESANESTFSAYMRIHARVNLEGLLSRLDTSTMAASVEGRVPFTDHSLVEWMFCLPDTYKMKLKSGLSDEFVRRKSVYDLDAGNHVQSKLLLRAAFSKFVPEQILKQRKVSFPVPFMTMFQKEWKSLYHQMLCEPEGPAALLKKGVPHQLESTSSVDAMLAWPMVNLFLWQQEFNVGFSS